MSDISGGRRSARPRIINDLRGFPAPSQGAAFVLVQYRGLTPTANFRRPFGPKEQSRPLSSRRDGGNYPRTAFRESSSLDHIPEGCWTLLVGGVPHESHPEGMLDISRGRRLVAHGLSTAIESHPEGMLDISRGRRLVAHGSSTAIESHPEGMLDISRGRRLVAHGSSTSIESHPEGMLDISRGQ